MSVDNDDRRKWRDILAGHARDENLIVEASIEDLDEINAEIDAAGETEDIVLLYRLRDEVTDRAVKASRDKLDAHRAWRIDFTAQSEDFPPK